MKALGAMPEAQVETHGKWKAKAKKKRKKRK